METTPYLLYVRGLRGELVGFRAVPTDTVLSLKTRFCDTAGLDVEDVRFIFTCVMEDDKTLSNYSVREGSAITPVIRRVRRKNIPSEQNDTYK